MRVSLQNISGNIHRLFNDIDLSNLGLTRCVDQYLVDIRAVDCEEGGTDALAGQFGHLFAEGGNPFFGTRS